MRVLITGSNGFLGKNLRLHLSERRDVEVICFTRENSVSDLAALIRSVDFVFHLAGINRAQNKEEFVTGNVELTQALCYAVAGAVASEGKEVPVIYTSSIQAALANFYGQSKRAAEDALFSLRHRHGVPAYVFRLPNVFGKWCKPHYNSAVATFCYNVARGRPIQVNDAAAPLTLVYVDDVVKRFLQLMDGGSANTDADGFVSVQPQFHTTVGEVAQLIQSFAELRSTLMTQRVGAGLVRALYATYVSYLPVEDFVYSLAQHGDARGVFVEMLRTPDCGQFSYFTAHPGITRGGHYHHSKTEKFVVICGQARFRFRHMQTGESHELVTSGGKAEIVETVPGWTHDITNIGTDELVVLLWANEVFDRDEPDTFASPL
jgi:UDP-2-acetamido-2,6-beta-L-arabino-hexul-4-ose reductase